MFHKAADLAFKEGTVLEVTFQDGKVLQYDMQQLFDKFPQLSALRDRELFLSGRLLGTSGIVWNDDLDIEAETIYQDGILIRNVKLDASVMAGNAVADARFQKGISQVMLSSLTGIDQSDISRIERGAANPSVGTLGRIAEALDAKLRIEFIPK